MYAAVKVYIYNKLTHRFTHSVCTHRTVRNPSAEQKAAKETVTAKPHTFEQTFTGKQLEDPRYCSEPEEIYAEMDDF